MKPDEICHGLSVQTLNTQDNDNDGYQSPDDGLWCDLELDVDDCTPRDGPSAVTTQSSLLGDPITTVLPHHHDHHNDCHSMSPNIYSTSTFNCDSPSHCACSSEKGFMMARSLGGEDSFNSSKCVYGKRASPGRLSLDCSLVRWMGESSRSPYMGDPSQASTHRRRLSQPLVPFCQGTLLSKFESFSETLLPKDSPKLSSRSLHVPKSTAEKTSLLQFPISTAQPLKGEDGHNAPREQQGKGVRHRTEADGADVTGSPSCVSETHGKSNGQEICGSNESGTSFPTFQDSMFETTDLRAQQQQHDLIDVERLVRHTLGRVKRTRLKSSPARTDTLAMHSLSAPRPYQRRSSPFRYRDAMGRIKRSPHFIPQDSPESKWKRGVRQGHVYSLVSPVHYKRSPNYRSPSLSKTISNRKLSFDFEWEDSDTSGRPLSPNSRMERRCHGQRLSSMSSNCSTLSSNSIKNRYHSKSGNSPLRSQYSQKWTAKSRSPSGRKAYLLHSSAVHQRHHQAWSPNQRGVVVRLRNFIPVNPQQIQHASSTSPIDRITTANHDLQSPSHTTDGNFIEDSTGGANVSQGDVSISNRNRCNDNSMNDDNHPQIGISHPDQETPTMNGSGLQSGTDRKTARRLSPFAKFFNLGGTNGNSVVTKQEPSCSLSLTFDPNTTCSPEDRQSISVQEEELPTNGCVRHKNPSQIAIQIHNDDQSSTTDPQSREYTPMSTSMSSCSSPNAPSPIVTETIPLSPFTSKFSTTQYDLQHSSRSLFESSSSSSSWWDVNASAPSRLKKHHQQEQPLLSPFISGLQSLFNRGSQTAREHHERQPLTRNRGPPAGQQPQDELLGHRRRQFATSLFNEDELCSIDDSCSSSESIDQAVISPVLRKDGSAHQNNDNSENANKGFWLFRRRN